MIFQLQSITEKLLFEKIPCRNLIKRNHSRLIKNQYKS